MTKLHNRGFFGIGIWHPQHDCNVGGLYRSATAFGASFLFTVGRKYKYQPTDTCNSTKHTPYYNYLTGEDLVKSLPSGCRLVCVEITDDARDLTTFCHPENTAYLLGNETMGIPPKFMDGKIVVKIPTLVCLNVASAGTTVIYDRISKMKNNYIYRGSNQKLTSTIQFANAMGIHPRQQ